jgi:hypothetical protein
MSDTAPSRAVTLLAGKCSRELPLANGRTMSVVKPGTQVEVRSRFESGWSRGFEVVDCDKAQGEPRYQLRRRSDGSILPVTFGADDLREERRRQTWWIPS